MMAIPVTEVAALAFAAFAATCDALRGRIPNALVLAGAFCACLLAARSGSFQTLLGAVEGLGSGILLLLVPFSLGWVGGGDVKLLGALGAFVGAGHVLLLALATALAGGLLALAWLAWFRGVRPLLRVPGTADADASPASGGAAGNVPAGRLRPAVTCAGVPPLPYACAMAVGTVAVYALPMWLR